MPSGMDPSVWCKASEEHGLYPCTKQDGNDQYVRQEGCGPNAPYLEIKVGQYRLVEFSTSGTFCYTFLGQPPHGGVSSSSSTVHVQG